MDLSRLNAEQLAQLAAHVAATYPEGGAAASTPADETAQHRRAELERANAEKGARMAGPMKIGGDFTPTPNPEFIGERLALFEGFKAASDARLAAQPRETIVITLPDGKQLEGTSYETTPLSIAEGISRAMSQKKCVAKVRYSTQVGTPFDVTEVGMEEAETNEEELEAGAVVKDAKWRLWDMSRPLEGSCDLELLGFEHPEGKMVFWHSSAHVLGQALEATIGAKITIGPPLQDRFYYDSYLGEGTLEPTVLKQLDAKAKKLCKADSRFERVLLQKEDALKLFAENPFKLELIRNKVPAGGWTSVYRNGQFVDLCPGPHIPRTKMIKAFQIIDSSSCYWGGHAESDVLQRCYAISFPDKKDMKSWQEMMKAAELRDHRKVGLDAELFFRHDLSPGSSFFLPAGAHMYNRLVRFIRDEYRVRGYTEVVTPNLFNCKLWKTSGHYQVRNAGYRPPPTSILALHHALADLLLFSLSFTLFSRSLSLSLSLPPSPPPTSSPRAALQGRHVHPRRRR